MSKYTRQLKSKYGAKRLIPATKPLFGLPADADAVIALADAPEHLVFADVDTGQEWVLPKASLSDIATIRTAKLKEMLNDPSRSADGFNLAFDVITSALSLDFGDMIRSMAAAAADCCLVLTYVQGGENQLLVLHIGSEKESQCSKIVKDVAQTYGPRFQQALPVSDTAHELARKYPHMSAESCGAACPILCEVLLGEGRMEAPAEPEPEPAGPPHCRTCGAELSEEGRFCSQCGAPRQA